MATPDPNDPNAQPPPTPPGDVPPQGATPQPAQSATSDYAGAWRSWLGDPENRASLMQFGVSMLQPVGVGQSQLGHFASSVGSAGEAATRVRDEAMARQKLQAETNLREQSANLAEQKAATAAQNLGLQGELLELRRQVGQGAQADALMKGYADAKLLDKTLTPEKYMETYGIFYKGKLGTAKTGLGGAGASTAGAATGAPTATKIVNGKTYYQRNGQWYDK